MEKAKATYSLPVWLIEAVSRNAKKSNRTKSGMVEHVLSEWAKPAKESK